MKRRPSARRWTIRVLGVSLLFACSTGPAPGNVGGCGATVPVADPINHCIDERFWRCRRDLAGGRIDEAAFELCRMPIRGACESAAWPEACEPNNDQTQACITLLSRVDLVAMTTEELLTAFPDCDLCP